MAWGVQITGRKLDGDRNKTVGKRWGVAMGGDGSLRVYFRDEIENALLGVFAAMASASGAEGADYKRGFVDALRSVALVFGVRVGDPDSRALSGGRSGI
jgi:hypothetical protein